MTPGALGVIYPDLSKAPVGAALSDLPDAKLRAMGLAVPSAGAPGYRGFKAALARTTHWVPPRFAIFTQPRRDSPPPPPGSTGPVAAGAGPYNQQFSPNWAGNRDRASYYTYVAGQWNEPSVYADRTSASEGRTSSEWVGLGEGTSAADVLVQAGTEADENAAGTLATDYVWWEAYPLNNQVVLSSIPVSAGQVLYASMNLNSNNTVTFTVENIATGAYSTFTKSLGAAQCLCGSAEAIVERTEVNGIQYPPLTDIGQVNMADVYTNGSSGYASIGTPAHDDIIMQAPDGNLLEAPGTWTDSYYSSFPVVRRTCGSAPCD